MLFANIKILTAIIVMSVSGKQSITLLPFSHIVNKTAQFTVCKKTWVVESGNEATMKARLL